MSGGSDLHSCCSANQSLIFMLQWPAEILRAASDTCHTCKMQDIRMTYFAPVSQRQDTQLLSESVCDACAQTGYWDPMFYYLLRD